jgi:SAM-dependent methyltransferase
MPANLYDYPRYYDLVFGSDWKAEFDFLRRVFDKVGGQRVRRVFEPACGTGRLLFRLALAGYQVSGLDLNPRAVKYCNQRLMKHRKPASVFVGIWQISSCQTGRCSVQHDQFPALAHGGAGAGSAVHRGGTAFRQDLCAGVAPHADRGNAGSSWSARRGHLGINTC